MNLEVIIPTRCDCATALAGLFSLAEYEPFALSVYHQHPLRERDLLALFALSKLGCSVRTEVQQVSGVGPARAQGIKNARKDMLVFLDDDVVLSRRDALRALSTRAERFAWAMPVMRWPQSFFDPPTGHTEIWTDVAENDPRVVEAARCMGKGWLRVFDLRHDVSTDQLAGGCFAVARERVAPFAEKLSVWLPGEGGQDHWLGKQLGPGVAARGVFAYHLNMSSGSKWTFEEMLRR